MIKILFLVLILSLVPFSQVKYPDESLKSLVLIQADFRTVAFPEIFGLEPTIPATLNLAEQTVPSLIGTKITILPTRKKGWFSPKGASLRGIIAEEILYL
jgi:hypothetical protein